MEKYLTASVVTASPVSPNTVHGMPGPAYRVIDEFGVTTLVKSKAFEAKYIPMGRLFEPVGEGKIVPANIVSVTREMADSFVASTRTHVDTRVVMNIEQDHWLIVHVTLKNGIRYTESEPLPVRKAADQCRPEFEKIMLRVRERVRVELEFVVQWAVHGVKPDLSGLATSSAVPHVVTDDTEAG